MRMKYMDVTEVHGSKENGKSEDQYLSERKTKSNSN